MGLMNAQWRMYDVSLGATELCHLHVEQTTTLRAIGWTGMLIVAGVGAWLGLRKPRYLLLIIVVAAAVALIVPDGLVPIISNLMLGTLLATVLVAVNSVPASLRRPTSAAQAAGRCSW